MKERRIGWCNMCYQQNVMVKYTNLYSIGSEGTELCRPCEMMVVEFIHSFASRCLDIRKDAHISIKKMPKSELDKSVKICSYCKQKTFNNPCGHCGEET